MNLDEMIAELSAGRDARARVPALETRIKDITSWKERTEQHNQELELNIIGYKQSIDALQAKVVDLTKVRDDAQFAQAEAEDKLNSFRKLIESASLAITGSLVRINEANASLDPSKPVAPAPTPVSEGPSEADPTATSIGNVTNDQVNAQSGQIGVPSMDAQSGEPVPSTPIASLPDPVPLAGGEGPPPEPKSDYERARMKQGLDWYDTDGICHAPLLIKA